MSDQHDPRYVLDYYRKLVPAKHQKLYTDVKENLTSGEQQELTFLMLFALLNNNRQYEKFIKMLSSLGLVDAEFHRPDTDPSSDRNEDTSHPSGHN